MEKMLKGIFAKKIFRRLCLLSLWLILVYSITLYTIQDRLIYYPDKFYTAPDGHLSVFQENIIDAKDNNPILTWYVKGKKNKPVILFFHGNSGQIAKFASHLLYFVARNYTVIMMEYRGFGAITVPGGQKEFFEDSMSVYDWLKEQGYEKIIVYGYSLGTSLAVNVAAHRQTEGLILTAPFSSMRILVKEKHIPLASLLLKDSYDSLSVMKNIQTPTLIIHGKEDKLIPDHHSKMLYDASESTRKSLIFLENEDHASIFFKDKDIPFILDWLGEEPE